MEMFGPGDVPVVDVMGRIKEGTFGGDNLILSMFVATGNGFVVDGSFRDLDGVYPMMTPVFSRGYHPGVRGNAILTGLNTPIRIGSATVMPGDIVLGDRMGIVEDGVAPDARVIAAAEDGRHHRVDAVEVAERSIDDEAVPRGDEHAED